ncbi:MAG: hypothetical protein JO307_25880 [Bryobacterales bacterium]|nr:hypothetical protein [Bryobacterales bacterium]MBV9397821.1 hypothetical protein [Bryobacterales bacterium]
MKARFAIAALIFAPLLPAQKQWTAPRTPDGRPDLQGVWTNATITPFERPAELASKPVLTEKEVAELERKAANNRVDRPPQPGDVGSYNQAWFDSGTKVLSTRQTSLVIDPPEGRVPVKPEAEAKRDFDLAHISDSPEYMSVWDRCITRGVPGGMFPAGYNNAYQIVQSPGYIVILYEMIHAARVIPLDGRPHLPESVKLWDGDSRGHWEGDTLIVDTTNYNNKGWIATSAATGRIKGIPQSEALHVIERFRRTSPDTLSYEVTINDPNEYMKPWKVAMPLTRDPGYQILEYACQEGNHAVENVLRNGRAQEHQQ